MPASLPSSMSLPAKRKTLFPFAIVFGASLIALTHTACVYAENSAQIHLSPEQIVRAGITSTAAVGAGTQATGTRIKGSDTSTSGQQLSGTVVAPTNAITVVSTVVGGVVQQIHVNSLQQVQAGSPVATLFSQQLMEMQREYLQLATQARLSKDKLSRDEALFNDGIIALGRLQESRAAATQAEVAANERFQALRAAGLSKTQLSNILITHALSPYLTVSAGVRGTLLELNLQVGQRIEAGMPVARISKDSALWIEFQASRQQAGQIRLGDLLQIKGCGMARVIAISPLVNSANQSILIRAQQAANDGCLQLNQFVEASHQSGRMSADSVGVPAAALVRNGLDAFVFVKTAQGFDAVKVQVVPGSADKVWVSGKVKAGQAVAVTGIVAIKGACAFIAVPTVGSSGKPSVSSTS